MKTFPVFAIVLLFCSLSFANVKIITSSPLPAGTVGTPYSTTVQAADGCRPYVWSSEGLPSGLTLTTSADTKSVTLTGTPTQNATLNFDITVKGCAGLTSTVDYTLTIGQGTSSHSAALTWDAGTQDIVGYNLYRGTTSGGPYSQINGSLLPSNAFTDSSVDSGTTYYYVATEVNSQGQESTYSVQATAVVP